LRKIVNHLYIYISWLSSNKMQANPEKFQAIAIGNKTHKQNIAFNLNGNNM